MENKIFKERKEISRGQFIKSSCALILCPTILSLINACGTEDDSAKDKKALGSGKFVTLDLNKNEYVSLQSSDSALFVNKGENIPEKGLIVYRKSVEEVLTFSPICPHQQELVEIKEEGWICSGHGAVFNKEALAIRGPAEGGRLSSYPSTIENNLIKISV